MFKIRDNVDLKELEKFGFYYWCNQDQEYGVYSYNYSKDYSIPDICIDISVKDRILKFHTFEDIYINDIRGIADLIYDLTQAGLIEKVME